MASTYYKYDELGGNGAYVPSNFTEFKVIETDILEEGTDVVEANNFLSISYGDGVIVKKTERMEAKQLINAGSSTLE